MIRLRVTLQRCFELMVKTLNNPISSRMIGGDLCPEGTKNFHEFLPQIRFKLLTMVSSEG